MTDLQLGRMSRSSLLQPSRSEAPRRPSHALPECEFHNSIARAAHNNLLLEIIVIAGGLLWEVRKRLVHLVPDRPADDEQHRRIYLAISGQDAPAAKAMRDHLQSALEL